MRHRRQVQQEINAAADQAGQGDDGNDQAVGEEQARGAAAATFAVNQHDCDQHQRQREPDEAEVTAGVVEELRAAGERPAQPSIFHYITI